MTTLKLLPLVGSFAENKDIAKQIRTENIMTSIDSGQQVILDFNGVTSATQSFIHALISDVIRKYGIKILDKLFFKNCNETVKQIINIVVDYMQS